MSNESSLITRINRQINGETLRQTVDMGVGPEQGGCQLYVQNKIKALTQAGIDPSRLMPWSVITAQGDPHSVLLVDGNTVLDNLQPWPMPKQAMDGGRLGYLFVAPEPKLLPGWKPPAPAPSAQTSQNDPAPIIGPGVSSIVPKT